MADTGNPRDHWLAGHGPIAHRADTVTQADAALAQLVAEGRIGSTADGYALLAAADRIACTAMSVVAHMTYAQRVDPGGALRAAQITPRELWRPGARVTAAGLPGLALRSGLSMDCQRSRSRPPIHWFRNSAVLWKSSVVLALAARLAWCRSCISWASSAATRPT